MRVSDSAVFMLLWFAALVDLPEACVFVVVVVVVVGDVMVGASVSAVNDALMLWCFASQCWTCWRLVLTTPKQQTCQ